MIKSIKLNNGVTLIFEEIPFVNSISCGIWVLNGSRNEDSNTNGISHFIEHMLFKGTKNRTATEIAEEMDAIGGQMNAFTSREYTCYYTRSLSNHFDISIDILADMFFNSLFSNEEILKESKVICEEIDMYEDTPEDVCTESLQKNIFKNQSLGYSILGPKKNVLNFNHDIFVNYFEKNYHQDNIVISIAGKFVENDMIRLVEKYFGSLNRKSSYNYCYEKPVYNTCTLKEVKDIEQVHLALTFPGIERGADETYTLSLLNTMFGGGMSSRLFQKIREENGLSYSVYSYSSHYKDSGLFTIYAGLNVNQTELALKLMINEINRIYIDKFTDQQLYKAKEQLKSNYLLSLESSYNRMRSIGINKLLLNRVLTADELIKKIDSVTISEIYDLSKIIFNLDKASLSIVGNVESFDVKELLNNAK